MENENPWERKKTNPGIDQLLEDLKTMVVGKKGGKKPPKKNGSNKPFLLILIVAKYFYL